MNFHDKILTYRKNNGFIIKDVIENTSILFQNKYSSESNIQLNENFNGQLIPGKIYIFRYNTNSKISKSIKYINYMPLGIYCGRGDRLLNGDRIEFFLDFIVIPPYYRAEILKRIYDRYSYIIEDNNSAIKSTQNPLDLRTKILKDLLDNTGYLNAYSGFKQKYIREIKIIDYDDWQAIPYVDINSVIGMDITEIYKMYQSKLNTAFRI